MSQMSKLLDNLSSLPPSINEGSVSLSSNDIEVLSRIRTICNGEIDALTAGISAIGNVFSDVADRIQIEDVTNIGWMLSAVANTVEGLHNIESWADGIIAAHEND
ncbi:MAG: hypothetical protein N0E59_08960 [Candidatus Thiodiazotropha taylori]|nr:hypothetical protein [Candidatus Thiodiazotropha taylori]MCG8096088.1 hypothetical protein [Candidatus Thiodiazotropha endolucinida]MCG8106623.1 hypothetical protein [Candidatus Thiodiazotropha taylori]MCG8110880.1 hypothetical protein [Candidatus Thiodiazotropha taylori]MCW4278960.1 hypothetical protein [Candidatus Thiodiazotropha taylori]